MTTLLCYTLGPIFVVLAIFCIFVIMNRDTMFTKNVGKVEPELTKAELAELYFLPEEVEACFTRFELKAIRKTFGRCYNSNSISRLHHSIDWYHIMEVSKLLGDLPLFPTFGSLFRPRCRRRNRRQRNL